jgi:vanillate O-demethylase monooxygenase subunit
MLKDACKSPAPASRPAEATKAGPDLATRQTPLLRNEWYVAALAEEVTRAPIRRTICEQDIVFYRDDSGRVVALQNRCAHRSYPLSNGQIKGDRIVCGYHGMEFGPDGRCMHIPSQQTIPAAMRVQPYPSREQGPFVWIWAGDPGSVNADKFVDQPWFSETGWANVHGYMYMRASYLGLHENLLDLSHFAFVHGAALARPEHASAELKSHVEFGHVHASVTHQDVDVSPRLLQSAGLVRPIDRVSIQDVPTPAIHLGQSVSTDSTQPGKKLHRYIVHFPTPETRFTTHYFWGIARDFEVDDEGAQEEAFAVGSKAFAEDKVLLEEIERLEERDRRPGFREKIIATDAGGVLFLRWLAARQKQEALAKTPT